MYPYIFNPKAQANTSIHYTQSIILHFFLKRGHPHFHYEKRKYQKFMQRKRGGSREGEERGESVSVQAQERGGYGLIFKFHIAQLPITRVLGFLGYVLN